MRIQNDIYNVMIDQKQQKKPEITQQQSQKIGRQLYTQQRKNRLNLTFQKKRQIEQKYKVGDKRLTYDQEIGKLFVQDFDNWDKQLQRERLAPAKKKQIQALKQSLIKTKPVKVQKKSKLSTTNQFEFTHLIPKKQLKTQFTEMDKPKLTVKNIEEFKYEPPKPKKLETYQIEEINKKKRQTLQKRQQIFKIRRKAQTKPQLKAQFTNIISLKKDQPQLKTQFTEMISIKKDQPKLATQQVEIYTYDPKAIQQQKKRKEQEQIQRKKHIQKFKYQNQDRRKSIIQNRNSIFKIKRNVTLAKRQQMQQIKKKEKDKEEQQLKKRQQQLKIRDTLIIAQKTKNIKAQIQYEALNEKYLKQQQKIRQLEATNKTERNKRKHYQQKSTQYIKKYEDAIKQKEQALKQQQKKCQQLMKKVRNQMKQQNELNNSMLLKSYSLIQGENTRLNDTYKRLTQKIKTIQDELDRIKQNPYVLIDVPFPENDQMMNEEENIQQINQKQLKENQRNLLSNQHISITINQKEGKYYIGEKVNNEYYTTKYITIYPIFIQMVSQFYEELKKVYQGIRIFPGSQFAMKKDVYKNITYYGLRRIKWYKNQPKVTRQGFNLTQQQMQVFIDNFNKSFE